MIARAPSHARIAGLLLAALASGARAAAAQDLGATAAAVLRVAPAPRPLALGGAYAPFADVLSVFHNPARLSAADPAAALAYRTLPVEAGIGAAALAARLGPGTFGIGAQFLNYGEIEVVEPDPSTGGEVGLPTGERVGGGELVATAAYGVRLGGRLEFGAAAKLIRLQLAEASASGAAFDIGAAVQAWDGRVALGASVQNLGGDIGPGRDSPLPRMIRAGAAVRLEAPADLQAVFVAEAVEQGGAVSPLGGIEVGRVRPGAAVVGRLGYDGSAGEGAREPFVAGAGILLGGLALDYAYRALGPLGATHVFGVTVRFR